MLVLLSPLTKDYVSTSVRVLSSLFVGPLMGPKSYQKLARIGKSWRNLEKNMKKWEKCWKNWKNLEKIGKILKKLEKIWKKLELFLGKGPLKIKLDRTLTSVPLNKDCVRDSVPHPYLQIVFVLMSPPI